MAKSRTRIFRLEAGKRAVTRIVSSLLRQVSFSFIRSLIGFRQNIRERMNVMKKQEKRFFCLGMVLIALFGVWTALVQAVDVQPVGPMGTSVGFAALNTRFHDLTGVHMWLYLVTDWLGLVPVLVCMGFGILGLIQLIRRRDLRKVDVDMLLLGLYYGVVILCYLAFEIIPVNWRPILIEGRLEASYPSSTTLLVLSVMPTLVFLVNRRGRSRKCRKTVGTAAMLFSGFMVLGRLISGVHWLTDIAGAVLLSGGLFCLYRAAVLVCCKEK